MPLRYGIMTIGNFVIKYLLIFLDALILKCSFMEKLFTQHFCKKFKDISYSKQNAQYR